MSEINKCIHTFIIETYRFNPAKKLGELILKINPESEVIYLYDSLCKDADKLSKLPNSFGHPIGYFTWDAGLAQIFLLTELSHRFEFGPPRYFHILSDSDLPTKGILPENIDKLVGDKLVYCYRSKVTKTIDDKLITLDKLIPRYSFSSQLLLNIKVAIDKLESKFFKYLYEPYVKLSNESDPSKRFSGSPDEYVLGYIFNIVLNQLPTPYKSTWNLRFELFPDKDKIHATDKRYTMSDYGVPEKVESPITLGKNDNVTKILNDNWCLTARKFDVDSEAYNYYYDMLYNS